jgi:uncharacterized heparinase superfamily protein
MRLHRPRVKRGGIPARRVLAGEFIEPIRHAASLLGPQRVRLLNQERCCVNAADWTPPDAAKLWIYNLHYFDDCAAAGASEREQWHRQLMLRWVAENPMGYKDGWEPYPVSRRVVNWIKWAQQRELPNACHESLALQVRWLTRRLEYHILGNHLLANAKALLFAGCYFAGSEAERWLERGWRILEREIAEQVLADGGHFELSPMYHATVLEDLLDVVNILRCCERALPAALLPAIERMRHWLCIMSHPDGDIAFFNDAAFDIAATPADLEAYAVRLGLHVATRADTGMVVLPSSGYVRLAGAGACVICDCAAVGPHYQPGHAHADTLSFELSIAGQRLFVNSGTSEYGIGPERQRQRGTRAHNTLMVDDTDSSEVWAGFRVARRARVQMGPTGVVAGAQRVTASHDGYRRLPGRVQHRRCWELRGAALTIEDRLSGRFERATAYFHLHPMVHVERSNDSSLVLSWAQRSAARVVFEHAAQVHVRRGTWHPRFGTAVSNHCILVTPQCDRLSTQVTWDEP